MKERIGVKREKKYEMEVVCENHKNSVSAKEKLGQK